MIEQRFEEA